MSVRPTGLPADPPRAQKPWSLVTPLGLFVLSSIGPGYGAVAAWVERERRRGLTILREGYAIRPVTIAIDPDRDEVAARAILRTIERASR